jgi:hypothetical protein
MSALDAFSPTTSWQGEPRALLERAIARHGGWTAWRAFPGVRLTPVRLRGWIPFIKGVGRTFPLPARFVIFPREQIAIFRGYPDAGTHGEYVAGRVRIVGSDGATLQYSDQPRATFDGLRKNRRWSALDALYFFGYALTHYHALPFSLVDARPLRLRRARLFGDGRSLTGVEVELPPSLHTHSPIQTFYFDDDGLLLRHDYVADIIGPWARGAHCWQDYVTVKGLPVARRRRVFACVGSVMTPLVALDAELTDAQAATADDRAHA